MTTEQIYGRRAVREALRGPREVRELWVSERALKAEPWLSEPGLGARHRVMAERDLTELVGTRDHQGVVAAVEPYRYADGYELAAVEQPLLVCLDQVTDPHNLGAVIRSAEGAGATGVIVPAHGSARVTAAVCRASAGAVEHMRLAVVPNLARFLGDVKGADLWVYGAAGEEGAPMWSADLSGGAAFVFGAEGRGLRPRVAGACDDLVALPVRGHLESLNVSAAAAALLYAILQRREGA